MPLILGAQSATAAAAFSVDNSCRFDRDSATYMQKTLGTPTSQTTLTFSCWCKRSNKISTNMLVAGWGDSGASYGYMNVFNAADRYDFYFDDGTGGNIMSDRLFRDYGAWYHIVGRYDTTEAASDDRIRTYVNGIEITSHYEERTVTQDRAVLGLASGMPIIIGRAAAGTNYFDGYIAEFCYIDGLALAPTEFGEFDEDSPTIWKAKDVSGLTFGNNGFHLDFKDSANLGNDANGGTDLTEYNLDATDQATDSPTNNFATMNSLENYYPAGTFTEGNCKVVTPGSAIYTPNTTTLGMSAGKWFTEVKLVAGTDYIVGITDFVGNWTSNTQELGDQANEWGYYGSTPGKYRNDSTYTTWGDTIVTDDVIGIALDLTNSKLYFSIDGVWQESGDPAAGTNGIAITAVASTLNGMYFFGCTGWANAAETFGWNLGGCSAFTVASANQDANGYGNFEYAVPSGYLALCTKNLGSDGG